VSKSAFRIAVVLYWCVLLTLNVEKMNNEVQS
jgi:hypothetical protein